MTGIPIRLASILAGRFHLERELGAGGMATVYLATDIRHDRKVAIKVMHPDLAAELGEERFLQEVRISANLQHPHIVPLFDSGSADGQLYFIMPYVEGETLRQRLRRSGELPPAEALQVLREIADALAYAHARGVIHRDLKPENILIAGRHIAIADFGVAKAVSTAAVRQAHLTRQGTAVGTPTYMAPEQAMGESDVDHLADIYALGVLGYEMLAGTPPFVGGTPQQLAVAHLTRTPEPLSRLRPTTSSAVETLVMRCLEKRPADRWQSADEVLAEVTGLLGARVGGPGPGAAPPEPAELAFPLTEEVCRQLDRVTLDPRIIGSELHYMDNRRESPTVVCLLHSVGADQRQYQEVCRVLPYRVLVPTLFGFEPEPPLQISLCLDDHLVLLRAFLEDAIARLAPRTVVLGGFSAGADVGLRLLASGPPIPEVDGFLALSGNLNITTCFASQRLANISAGEQEILADLRALGAATDSLKLWLVLHEYLVTTLRKFTGNTEVLRRFSADIVRPFQGTGEAPFLDWYRTVSARVKALRCVFEDGEPYDTILAALRLRHMDSGVLGEHHRHGAIARIPGADHFDLIEPVRVAAEVEALLAAVDEARATARTTKAG